VSSWSDASSPIACLALVMWRLNFADFFLLEVWQIFLAFFWWIFDQRIAGFGLGNQISVH
jgi:hypothetical protein